MSARADISKKNEYWISKHRYYELKHFCLQYPEWKKALRNLSYISNVGTVHSDTNKVSDPTGDIATLRERYKTCIDMVDRCGALTDDILGEYVIVGVTRGVSYDTLHMKSDIPCGKDIYYQMYRKFFWLLDKERS